MKKNSVFKKGIALGLTLAMGVMAFTACGGGGDDGAADAGNGDASVSGTVVTAGSTSVQPLSEMLAEEFMAANKDIMVEIQGGGSGQGITAIEEGIADFGALSRELDDEEKGKVGEEFVIAQDGIAVVVNTETELEDITLDQLKQIYTGEVTNWSDLGGADAEITVVSREEGSGTRGAFTELTGVLGDDDKDNTVPSALIQGSTGAVAQTVASTPNSIGYVSLGSLNDTVKALKVEGVEATTENVLNKTYKLSRPFIYVSGTKISEPAQAYLDFIMSEDGQAIVEEAGFISVI
jgi:phosphate transport system substrate-binding protein